MRKHYSAAFKAKIVQEMLREEKTMTQIAADHGIHPNQLTKWKATVLQGLPRLFDERDTTADLKAAHEKEVTDLYAEIGRLTTQLAWLKKKSGLDHG
jgi:transposase